MTINVHKLARAGDEHAPAVVACWCHDVAHILVVYDRFAVGTTFHFPAAIFLAAGLRDKATVTKTVRARANVSHAPLQVDALHDRLGKPDLINGGILFGRYQVECVW